jgi:Bacterial Ig-like domain (group 3)
MRRLLMITLCGAAVLMVAGASNAGATVTPSCIPTSNTPFTVTVPGITASNESSVGILWAQPQGGSFTGLSYGVLSNETLTASGLTATATFPAGLASVTYDIAAFFVAQQLPAIDVGSITVGCGATPHPTSTTITCAPPFLSPGDRGFCDVFVTDTASSGPIPPSGTITFSSTSPATFSPNPCPVQGGGTSTGVCIAQLSTLAIGPQTITASYSGDAAHDPSSASTLLTVPAPADTQGCRVSFKGQVRTSAGDLAHIAGTANGTGPTGRERYRDRGPANALLMRSHSIDAVSCPAGGRRASVYGTGSLAGASVSYRIDVTAADGGTYRIRMSNGYDSSVDKLRRGSIRIVRPG